MSADKRGQSAIADEDPLVAALPPATDYLTYLTLLEYQLKPANLSTLNRILSEDDGKLVEEIGWDLLRLVLPMLTDVYLEASDCLQIIARRGNPREVVVRVAEELEKLGKFDGVDAEEDEEGGEEEELPTFAGEATRIHLGEMKLDGMPETQSRAKDGRDQVQEPSVDLGERTVEQESLIFQALLSTLSTLHPRIKTQYPSRFLATSLPAALGAYRRMPVTIETTRGFLDCLRKLSGKQRPALPPRTSTAGDSAAPTARPAPNSTAPLPDPEAAAESETGVLTASENEKAIIHRLLQAVLLEIMDDYLSSLQHQETASMHWTSRLRENLEPKRVVPGRSTEHEKWEGELGLVARDALMNELLSLSDQLGLDPIRELRVVTGQDDTATEPSSDAEDVSEYPTSPSHIPFPTTGLIELAAATVFTTGWTNAADDLDIVTLFKLIQLPSENPLLPNSAVQDALCSILYQHISQPELKALDSVSEIDFIILMAMLTQTFTISPDSQTRDDAHHISTKILHEREPVPDRVDAIKQTLSCSYKAAENQFIPLAPPYSEGTLKSVGVDWLKDEISVHSRQAEPTVGRGGIDPRILDTDQGLHQLVLPNIPSLQAKSLAHPDITTSILLSLPFYISIMNLACVLFSGLSVDELPMTFRDFEARLNSLLEWKGYLVDEMLRDEAVKDSASDIFALEDACDRAKVILAKARQISEGLAAGREKDVQADD